MLLGMSKISSSPNFEVTPLVLAHVSYIHFDNIMILLRHVYDSHRHEESYSLCIIYVDTPRAAVIGERGVDGNAGKRFAMTRRSRFVHAWHAGRLKQRAAH